MAVDDNVADESSLAWQDQWAPEKHSIFQRGGQGTVQRVVRIADGAIGALKELHRPYTSERRFRIQMEAIALKNLNGEGVPRILEDATDARSGPPFIVMEWIDGVRLSDRCSGRPMPLDDALRMADALLNTLDRMHRLPIYHRDLKADNIILRDENPGCPIIVDLGMAWTRSDGEIDDFDTPDGQELGNRSLRLPEFAPGNPTGRTDPRSDVAMLLGVLFFALTGKQPRVLMDERGRKPHERNDAIPPETITDSRWRKLRGVFTIGFEPEIENRFQSVAELRDRLMNLSPPAATNTHQQIEEAIAEINNMKSSVAARRLEKVQAMLRASSEAFLGTVQRSLSGSGFVCAGSGPNFDPGGRTDEISFVMHPSGMSSPQVGYKHRATFASGGIEMAACAGGRTLRTYHKGHLADIDEIREAAEREGEEIAVELLRLMTAELDQQYGSGE